MRDVDFSELIAPDLREHLAWLPSSATLATSSPPTRARTPENFMARMGHDSERAALIYLHSSRERQRALTDAVGEAARAELARSRPRKAAKLEGTKPPLGCREWWMTCAPTATRTRDLPLRRRSLYPLSYRGLPKANVTWDGACPLPSAGRPLA